MRVSIIGLGLIGGSLGLALRRAWGRQIHIVGYARNPEVAADAVRLGAVDSAAPDLQASARSCDMAFICTPVRAVQEVIRVLSLHAPPGCVVTDTSSTKQQVMAWAEEYLYARGIGFVGGHPMAGKERFGIRAAEADLFQGCTYCITPAQWTSSKDVEATVKMVESIGGKPFFVEAQEHDHLVAAISHLPILVSAAMVAATVEDERWPVMARLASSGYRDITRLASGSAAVNAGIFATNGKSTVHWIDRFIAALGELKDCLKKGDADLEERLKRVSRERNRWLERKYGPADPSCQRPTSPDMT